jgi:hypothetical protein
MKEEQLSGSISLNSSVKTKIQEDVMEKSITAPLVLLLAVATGMGVASIYYLNSRTIVTMRHSNTITL